MKFQQLRNRLTGSDPAAEGWLMLIIILVALFVAALIWIMS